MKTVQLPVLTARCLAALGTMSLLLTPFLITPATASAQLFGGPAATIRTSATDPAGVACVPGAVRAYNGGLYLCNSGGQYAGTGDLLAANNLSDVANASTARSNLGLLVTVGTPASTECDAAGEAGRMAQDSTNGRFFYCAAGAGWRGVPKLFRENGLPTALKATDCDAAAEIGISIYFDISSGGLTYGCLNAGGTPTWTALGSGSFTVATQAEAEAGTENTKGMTALRVAQAIQANVEGGSLITCTPTAAGVECSGTSAVMRVSTGLASALPVSCTIAGAEWYLATDTGIAYACDGSVYRKSGAPHEVSFVIGAGANLAVSDTVAIPRLITTATAGTLQKLYAKAGTGPVGSALTIDLKINGTTTATVTVADGATLGSTTTFSTPTLAENDVVSVVVTAVGSGTPGKDVHVIAVVR